MYLTTTVIESQPDWLTVGTPQLPPDSALYRLGDRLSYIEWWQGNRDAYYSEHGYRMLQCGRAHVGTGKRGTLVKLSGDLAAEELDSALAASSRVSRLDVAVTVQFPTENPTLAEEYYHAYQTFKPHGHRKAAAELRQHSDGGATLYLGSRQSDYLLRVYNKAAESKDARYARCWRAELQCNRDAASRVARSCPSGAARPAWAQALVYDYLSDHGLSPCWPRAGNRVLTPGFRRRSDADTQLRWLASQVRPTLERLRRAGYHEEVRRVLDGDRNLIPTRS